MENVLYSRFKIDDENTLKYAIEGSSYIIDETVYMGSASIIKYSLLDEHFRPTLIIKFKLNDKKEKELYHLFCEYAALGRSDICHIQQLYRHEDYVVRRASLER